MNNRRAMWTLIVCGLLAIGVAAQNPSQTQQQGQPQQAQPQQQQQSNQQQPAQKPQNLWQRLKTSAKQMGQNTTQQGTQQVQQGAQQIQQGAQQQVQGVQQGVQQQVQGVQQQVQQVPGQAGNAAFGGSASGANLGNNSSCGPSCFDAGPFQAMVTQMTMSQQGYWHIIRMNMQFHNATNQPLIIAYREGSMVMVDNNGNTYGPAGGNPGELQGMGIDRGSATDSGFQLAPGQTGNAMFTVARTRGNDSAIGTGFTYNFTIDELQTQNGAQAAIVRQYNLNFPSLAPSTVAASTPSNGFLGKSAGSSGTTAAQSNAYGNPQAITRTSTTATQPAVGKGAALSQGVTRGGSPATSTTATQRGQAAVPATAAAVKTTTAATTVNNATVRSTATTAAKPSAAVKPVPTTTPAKKPATTATTGASR